MNWRTVAVGLLFLIPGSVAAQSANSSQETIEKLLARIESLEKRVAELEKEKGSPNLTTAAAPATPDVTRAAAETAQAHAHDQPPVPPAATQEPAQPVYPYLKLTGFGDVDFSATTLHASAPGFGAQTLLNGHSGFELGQTTLHLISALSPKVNFFGEITFTARSDAGTGTPPATGFNAEVERLILRYDFNDHAKISFGRYHTPINYWNTAFHHGQWLQTSISRPEMVQFGGSFIPVHFIGALGEGALTARGLNFNYQVGIGNGRGQVISRGGDAGDINNNRAWLLNTFIRPDFLYGLQIGGSVYRDEVNPVGVPVAREWIESAHIVWTKETPEIIAEFANVTHQPIFGGPVSNSQAWYAQVAYRLPWLGKVWKPYYRIEQIHVPRSDAIFRAVPTFTASTSGLRYDFTSFAAFKVEYRYYWRRDVPDFHGVFSQLSFTF